MTAPTSKRTLSAPFADRELNGELLLKELEQLRESQVQQKHLNDCALVVKPLRGLRVSESISRIRELAGGRFQGQPALASLLVRWGANLRTEEDIAALISHVERLALTAALLGAVRRGAARIGREGGGRRR
jgi:hypothetical protein